MMDNVPAYKLASIEHRIESVGAKVLNLSPYSPDFNPIELCFYGVFLQLQQKGLI